MIELITIYWCFHGCNLFKISSADDPADSTSLDAKIALLRRPKTAVSTCQRPLAVCHLLRPVHRLTQTISPLGRKNENATIWETSSRETNYIKTYIYDFVTLFHASCFQQMHLLMFFWVIWCHIPTFHPPHAVNVPIFQLPRLRQHNKTSHFGKLVTLPAQCWVSLLPGHCWHAQELEVPALNHWQVENTWHNGKYTFENQQQDFEQRKTYELHSEEHHHEFGKRPLAETQKMHSGRFIANLQGQMVALTFWFWLLYRVQIGRCLNLESLQTHSLTSSYRGIKKLNTCNKLW